MRLRNLLRPKRNGVGPGETRYLVLVRGHQDGFGAHVPDLPGCVAADESRAEVLRAISDAMATHITALREAGRAVPPPARDGVMVAVAESTDGPLVSAWKMTYDRRWHATTAHGCATLFGALLEHSLSGSPGTSVIGEGGS